MNPDTPLQNDALPEGQVAEPPLPEAGLPGNRLPGDSGAAGSLGEVRTAGNSFAENELPANESAAQTSVPADRVAPPRIAPPLEGTGLSDSLQSLLGTVVIAVFVITFIVQAFQIPSPSMEKTLLIGDYLLVNKLVYGGGGVGNYFMPYRRIQRGDIIVFHYPVNPAQHFVKRVIAGPGDRLRLINKQVYVNGVPQKEPYAHFSRPANDLFRDSFPRLDVSPGETPEWWVELRKLVEDGQLIVPEGNYFVMGDNRDDSYDSRYWGFVPRANIIGRPLVIYWSVQGTDGNMTIPASVRERLYHFAYVLTHVFQITRWDRTFRLVR
jgi:signal peptidase I